jgi:predicted esterase
MPYFISSESETTVKAALRPVGRGRGFVVGRAAVVHDDADPAGVGRQAHVDGGARAGFGQCPGTMRSVLPELRRPQGFNNGWANSGGQEVTLADDMIKQLEGDLCVDTTRVFSVGFSYGAAMSYALTCARANVFRAAALYSGGRLSGCSGGTIPIAYLASHGINDGVLSISGGRPLRGRFVRNNR